MKKILTLLTLLTMATATFAQKAGEKCTFNTTDLQGNAVSDSVFAKNKLTMINIWGTFCPPCIREMPDLAKLSEANKNKGVEVMGIVIDIADRFGKVQKKQQKDADAIIAATGANYTHLIPSMEMQGSVLRNIQAVPSTIFVGSDGKQIGDMYLGARSQKDWQKIIDDLLAKEK